MKQTSATVADGGSNVIVLRYADVLLMLAECYAEKDNVSKSNEYLNLIKEVIFFEELPVGEDDFIAHSRKEIQVKVPMEARTGDVTLADASSEDSDALRNLIHVKGLVVILPSVEAPLDLTAKKPGDEIVVKGKDLDLVNIVKMPNGEEVEFDYAKSGEGEETITFILPENATNGAVVMIPASGVEVAIANIGMALPEKVVATPDSGLRGGDMITLTGINMELVTTVTFPGVEEAMEPASKSATEVEVVMPVAAISGELLLNTASGTSVPVAITTLKPEFMAFVNDVVSLGSDVIIQGKNLDLVAKVVYTGGAEVEVTPTSTTELTIAMPTMGTESGVLTLVMGNGEMVETGKLTINAPEFCYIPVLPGEDEELEKLYRKLDNGKKILETLQEVRDLTGNDSVQGAGEAVGNAVKELMRVTEYDSQLESMSSALQEIDGLLNDFNRELSSYVEDLNFDDETFFETEKRLDLINNLKAKYGQSIEEIQKYGERQKQKLSDLDRYEELFQEARENLLKSQKKLEEVSYALSEIRQKYSKTLTDKIIEGLKDLNFLDVQFRIDFKRKEEYTAGGFDNIEYEISTNPGESVKPLGRIVSGGELSRIMLAIKAILADRDQIETLIFDEIDTGISGRTAQKVSEKMSVIGRHHQVLCITHLPQIAAMADTHFEIEKHQRGTETITEIHPLEGEDSIQELARLLGGAEITQAVYQNAKEMKELAQVHKNTRLK